jgi:nitroreductase
VNIVDLEVVDLLLSTTRSVRKRLDFSRPVDANVVVECVRLAVQAPTAQNAQNWRWMVVTDGDKRDEIARIYREVAAWYFPQAAAGVTEGQNRRVYESARYLADNLHRAPLLVIPCLKGDINWSDRAEAAGAFGSILPAAWSFMLALRSRGLGTAWTSLHLYREREVAGLLSIPDGVVQVALFPVAHTIGTDFRPAVRRPVEKIIYWDRWGATRS